MSSKDEIVTKGKLVKLKLNVTKEKKNGDEYKAHVMVIEDDEGEEHKFVVNSKAPAAKFIKDLKEKSNITVKQVDHETYGLQVVAVFDNDRKTSKYAGTNRKPADATGAIQGMVLKAAIDIALSTLGATKKLTANDINEAAAIVLESKPNVDKMVVAALKDVSDDKDKDEDDDDNDDPKGKSKAKAKKSKKESEESDDDDEESEDVPF